MVEVVGGVGRVHYPGAGPREQVWIAVFAVVLLPVDAARKGRMVRVSYRIFCWGVKTTNAGP